MEKNVVIAGYARSPFTFAHKGEMVKLRPDEMAAQVVRGLIERSGIDPKDVEDLIVGCAFPEGEQGLNVARLIGFLAELPISVAGTTVNRFCGSSMQAIHMAAGNIQMNAGEAFICAGIESMSRVPMAGFNPLLHPGLAERFPAAYISMGETAENVAEQYNISREDQDLFAFRSQQKTARAQQEGVFAEEIVPVSIPRRKQDPLVFDTDEHPRASTLEKLAALPAPFRENGSVTAGNASGVNDGAAAMLVASEAAVKQHGLKPMAKILGMATAGVEPRIMGIGPVPAVQKLLKKQGISLNDIDVIELNEAFAAQGLAVLRELGIADDDPRVNPNGGAIALGHPLGMSGARLLQTAAHQLQRTGGRYALCTMCVGVGQGIATLIERV